MEKNKEKYFTITDNKGVEIEYEILFTFDLDSTEKSYIVFTDNKKDEAGNIFTYAASYKKNGEELELNNITTDEEWNTVKSLLKTLEEKINNEE